MQVNTCPECGVPEYIASEHLWNDCGLIVQKRDQRHTVTFIENDNLDAVIRGVEEVIGASIEPIVINTRRRAGRAYMDRLIPKAVRDMVQKGELELKPLFEAFFTVGHVLGYGRFELVDYRYRGDDDDYFTVRVERPYSILLGSVDPAAACEVLIGRELGFTYEQVSEGVFDIKAFPASHPEEYKGRLRMKLYEHKPGDIELASCPGCGAPAALASFRWDLEKGLIHHARTGRRMVFFAPTVLDAVFAELENELGESIPQAVVEAQRRFARGFYSPQDLGDAARFREALALRGIGNLREFAMAPGGLHMRLDNAAMHLLLVGLVQGVFELAYETRSSARWELSDQGSLEVEILPRRA